MAAIEPEGIFQRGEPLGRRAVPRIGDPAIGLEQDGGAEEAIAVPPVTRAGGGAAEAEDALPQAVEPLALLGALEAFAAVGRRRLVLEPRFNRGVLSVSLAQVGHQVLDHLHVGQRVHFHVPLYLADPLDAGQGVDPVDVHGATAADPFPAGTAEGEGGIGLVLDLDQGVENHGAAIVEIDLEAVEPGIVVLVRVPAVDLEGLHLPGPLRRGEVLAPDDPGIPRKQKFNHHPGP